MSDMRSNKIYICNIDNDVNKFNKQFQHSILPSNTSMSMSTRSESTKYDDRVFKRECQAEPYVFMENNLNTKPALYNKNIHTETTLRNTVDKNNECNYNNYIPSTESDLYKLNVPYENQHGKHDLLFEIPHFSSSCTAPVINAQAFHNFTREQRNIVKK